jgi:sulfate adenylyltransferase
MIPPHGGKLIERILKDVGYVRSLRRIDIKDWTYDDILNIAHGVYSPLEGFVSEEELLNILEKGRLRSGLPWTIPIILDVDEEIARRLKEGEDLALYNKGVPVGVIHLEGVYPFDKRVFCELLFETMDSNHPGVEMVKGMGGYLLFGKVDLIHTIKTPFGRYTLYPKETRFLFKEKGWRTVAGFQTRNIPHLGHEYVQKTTLTFVDGIFINPVVGYKKRGDFHDEVILKTYEALIAHYYLKERAVMSIFKTRMYYAGPKEAVHHAICRKNFGCTHFIVGRDHAGTGGFYSRYAAHEIFERYEDLGISPIFFHSFFWCKRCGGVMNEKTCPHPEEEHIDFSGTRIRHLLKEGRLPPRELMREEVASIILQEKNPYVV